MIHLLIRLSTCNDRELKKGVRELNVIIILLHLFLVTKPPVLIIFGCLFSLFKQLSYLYNPICESHERVLRARQEMLANR